MGAYALLSLFPYLSFALLHEIAAPKRGGEDFGTLFTLLSTFPILLGIPFSFLLLFLFKKGISTERAQALAFFPSRWLRFFIIPCIVLLTFQIPASNVEWCIGAVILDVLWVLYFIGISALREIVDNSFFNDAMDEYESQWQ